MRHGLSPGGVSGNLPANGGFRVAWEAAMTATPNTILGAIFAGLLGLASTHAQTPAIPISGVEPALIEDIVAGSRILADFGVVDAFGHVSARHPSNPNHFLMSRSLAPALVTAGDIMEFDFDGNAVDARGRQLFLERFIHGEIYKARPDVMAVVHTHSPGVIPFTVSQVPLRPLFHNAAFLGAGAPVWEIRKDFGETDMLVRDAARGKSLAGTLGDKSVVLMRGHGDVTVGPSVKVAVFRAYYTDVNARLQAQAKALGGDVNYLTPEEGAKADAVNLAVVDRVWNLWKMRVAAALAK
jgi:HCOMODA/2-hydroxy-3-carboxy-muconic semialdehyde decarboxylase